YLVIMSITYLVKSSSNSFNSNGSGIAVSVLLCVFGGCTGLALCGLNLERVMLFSLDQTYKQAVKHRREENEDRQLSNLDWSEVNYDCTKCCFTLKHTLCASLPRSFAKLDTPCTEKGAVNRTWTTYVRDLPVIVPVPRA